MRLHWWFILALQRCWYCKEKKENKKDKKDKNEKTVSQACYVIPFFCADNSALLRDTISKIGKRRWELGMESFDVGAAFVFRAGRMVFLEEHPQKRRRRGLAVRG